MSIRLRGGTEEKCWDLLTFLDSKQLVLEISNEPIRGVSSYKYKCARLCHPLSGKSGWSRCREGWGSTCVEAVESFLHRNARKSIRYGPLWVEKLTFPSLYLSARSRERLIALDEADALGAGSESEPTPVDVPEGEVPSPSLSEERPPSRRALLVED